MLRLPRGVSNLEEGRAILPDLPCLPERLADFQTWLEEEPCTHPGNAEVIARIKAEGREPEPDFCGCLVISNTSQMCPACRLRHAFFHCVYNAEAYRPALVGIDEIQELDGETYIWQGVDGGDCDPWGNGSNGWRKAQDHMVCVRREHHELRTTPNFALYCPDCGKYPLTLRECFATEEEFQAHVTRAQRRADERADQDA